MAYTFDSSGEQWFGDLRNIRTMGICALPRSGAERVVFAAIRYRENAGLVYPDGASHLYRIRADGGGLRQLSFGKDHELAPTLSLNGKRLFFWRTMSRFRGKSDYPSAENLELCSMDFNGRRVRRSGFMTKISPSEGLVHAVERYGGRLVHKRELKGKKMSFSPLGTKAVAVDDSGDHEISILEDMRTGRRWRVNRKYEKLTWVDEKTVLAVDMTNPEDAPVCELNAHGKEVRRGGSMTDTSDAMVGFAGRVSRSHTVIWQWHHMESDGGYVHAYAVDLRTLKFGGFEEGVEAVSPLGKSVVKTVSQWVGEYKRAGGARLDELAIEDMNSEKKRKIGFRRMVCWGACYLN